MPNRLSEQILLKLKTNSLGRVIHEFSELASTNDWALEHASKEAREGELVIADQQTAGKGRWGRFWYSPPKRNLYMSVILQPTMNPHYVPRITLIAGAAACEALGSLTGLEIKWKWPNDLVFGERKLGGILCESQILGNEVKYVIVGVGINILIKQDEFPDDLQQTATSLQEISQRSFDRSDVAAAILNSLEIWYERYKAGEWPAIINWCDAHCVLKRQAVMITAGKEKYRGIAEGLDNEGHLVVMLESGDKRNFSAGDVTLTHTE